MTLAKQLAQNKNLKGEAFNFSNETQNNALELTNLIIKTMESDLKPVVQGKNCGEIKAQYLDSTKAKEVLAWKAEFDLEEGLRKTIDWYKEFLEND